MRGWLVSVVSAGILAFCASASAEIELPIPARNQSSEAPKAGWCGETAIQEALLYYGAYLPQSQINSIGEPQNPDLYWSDIPRTLRRLGFRFRSVDGWNDLPRFVDWIRQQLDAGRPVFAGIKIYPTAHPRWALDHMVLIVGHDDEGLAINTTWGRRETRSRRELSEMSTGLAFANRMRSYNAFALDGLSARAADASSVRLTVRSQSQRKLAVDVVAAGLVSGRRYRLVRYAGPRGRLLETHQFIARSSKFRRRIELGRSVSAYFEIVPL